MTAALEIKPGKYRTFEGDVVTIEYVLNHVAHGKTFSGQPVSFALLAHGVSAGNLIERIEDEPKAEDRLVKFRKCEIPGFVDRTITKPVGTVHLRASRFPDDDFHVSYGAREEIRRVDGNMYETQFCAAVKWCAQRNLKLITMGEWDGPPIIPEKEAALNAKIARLEAENESLSRQLRSRAINAEPASSGKVWRWSPLV